MMMVQKNISLMFQGFWPGTQITINGTTHKADNNGDIDRVEFAADSTQFELKPPANWSGDMNGVTLTLSAEDTDTQNSQRNAIKEETDSVTLNLHVESVPDDVTLDNVSTQEDTAVKFINNLQLTDTDGSESVTGIELLKSKNNDLDNWTLKDNNGNIINPDANGDYIITDTLANLENYTLIPPGHSSLDTDMVVGVKNCRQ